MCKLSLHVKVYMVNCIKNGEMKWLSISFFSQLHDIYARRVKWVKGECIGMLCWVQKIRQKVLDSDECPM